MRRYLVVANVTLAGPALMSEVVARQATGPCQFHIVVPASREHGSVTHVVAESQTAAR